MYGVTKPVELAVTFNSAGPNPLAKEDAIGFSATTVFSRSEWGDIAAYVGTLGDEIAVPIELEAIKSQYLQQCDRLQIKTAHWLFH